MSLRRPLVNVSGVLQELPAGDVLPGDCAVNVDIGDGVNAIAAAAFCYLVVPFAFTVTGWKVVADASGSIVVDVKRSTYSGFPTTSTIAGSEKPTLSSAQKAEDTSLSSWTTSIAALDVLHFIVDSAATVKKVTVILTGTKA